MSIAYSYHQQSFVANALTPLIHKQPKTRLKVVVYSVPGVSCKYSQDDQKPTSPSRRIERELGKLAVVTLAAGVLTLGCVGGDASAAKSGGRVGGQAFRSAPRMNNSRTNIYINPPVAPPLVGGYGYGYGIPFFGGWGWSPFTFFAPGPSVAIGVGGGFELFAFFVLIGAVAAVIRRLIGSRDEDEY